MIARKLKAIVLGLLFVVGYVGAYADDAAEFVVAKKACDVGNAKGCFTAGNAYLHGRGVLQSCIKATPFFAKACKLKSSNGCKRYAEMRKFCFDKDMDSYQGEFGGMK